MLLIYNNTKIEAIIIDITPIIIASDYIYQNHF